MAMQFLADRVSWLDRMIVKHSGKIKALEIEIQELKKQIKTADSICLEDPEPCVAAKLVEFETRIKEMEVVNRAAASKKDTLEYLVQHWIEEHGCKHEADNIVRINTESRIEGSVNAFRDELNAIQTQIERITLFLEIFLKKRTEEKPSEAKAEPIKQKTTGDPTYQDIIDEHNRRSTR